MFILILHYVNTEGFKNQRFAVRFFEGVF